jgi:hypothetical protein
MWPVSYQGKQAISSSQNFLFVLRIGIFCSHVRSVQKTPYNFLIRAIFSSHWVETIALTPGGYFCTATCVISCLHRLQTSTIFWGMDFMCVRNVTGWLSFRRYEFQSLPDNRLSLLNLIAVLLSPTRKCWACTSYYATTTSTYFWSHYSLIIDAVWYGLLKPSLNTS